MAPLRGCIKFSDGEELDDLQTKMITFSDFCKEKSLVETFTTSRSHGNIMLPKFHCELNPIE